MFWGGLASLMAQDVLTGVTTAFQKGNSRELHLYMGERVALAILDDSKEVDKQSAEGVMSAFFSDNKVHQFDMNHKGKRGESGFIVGTLRTTKGSFRVNCFLKRIQNKYLIYQIRIEKADE